MKKKSWNIKCVSILVVLVLVLQYIPSTATAFDGLPWCAHSDGEYAVVKGDRYTHNYVYTCCGDVAFFEFCYFVDGCCSECGAVCEHVYVIDDVCNS